MRIEGVNIETFETKELKSVILSCSDIPTLLAYKEIINDYYNTLNNEYLKPKNSLLRDINITISSLWASSSFNNSNTSDTASTTTDIVEEMFGNVVDPKEDFRLKKYNLGDLMEIYNKKL